MAKTEQRYFIKPPYDGQPMLITRFPKTGELINLLGEDKQQVLPAKRNQPGRTVKAKGATQQQLAYLMEQDRGNWSKIIGDREGDTKAADPSK